MTTAMMPPSSQWSARPARLFSAATPAWKARSAPAPRRSDGGGKARRSASPPPGYLRRRGADQLAPHHLREDRLIVAVAALGERDQALRQLGLRHPVRAAAEEKAVLPHVAEALACVIGEIGELAGGGGRRARQILLDARLELGRERGDKIALGAEMVPEIALADAEARGNLRQRHRALAALVEEGQARPQDPLARLHRRADSV